MTDIPDTPRLSCIITAYNEGALAKASVRSVLNQSFRDFELILVDDGASEATRSALRSFDDPRIRHLRQANDGLSSARNRGIGAARGDYLCFLDADDTRPVWAFDQMVKAAKDDPDCVFSPGCLHEPTDHVSAFYDQSHFEALATAGLARLTPQAGKAPLAQALRRLTCIEPQSANKMVRRSFIERHSLRFPSGLFFEDILFHICLLMNLESYAVTDLPTFTYYRRYGPRQITGGKDLLRFDSLSTAGETLHLFSRSRHFQDVQLRTLILAATCRLVKWCEDCLSHDHRAGFRQAARIMFAQIHPQYMRPLSPQDRAAVQAHAPWVDPALSWAFQVAGAQKPPAP